MKKVLSAVAVMALIGVGSLFAKPMGDGPDGKGKGMEKPGMHQGPGGMHEDMMGGEYGILIRMAGLDTLKEKYDIQMQRIMLDSKEASLDLKAKKQSLRKEVSDLSDKYDTDPAKVGPQISKLLEELAAIENKMADLRQEAMDKIHKLHQDEQKELRKGIQDWMKTLSKDPAEMKKFVDHVKMMKDMMQGKMDHDGPMDPKGPKGPK